MLDIIKVQLFRLKKSVLFWVMLGVTAAMPVLGALFTLTATGLVDSAGGGLGELLTSMGLTTQYLTGMGQLTSWALIFSLITTAIVLSTEFVDGTVRNILLANKTRGELYFSYLITSLIVAVTYLLGYFVALLLVVAPIFGFDGMEAGKAISACLCSLAMGFAGLVFIQTCMCMFLFVIRKQWAAILLPLLICMFVPGIILAFATLIMTTSAIKGLPVSLDDLRWIPLANSLLYNAAEIDGVTIGMNILYLMVFSAVFVVAGYFTFKKADLK